MAACPFSRKKRQSRRGKKKGGLLNCLAVSVRDTCGRNRGRGGDRSSSPMHTISMGSKGSNLLLFCFFLGSDPISRLRKVSYDHSIISMYTDSFPAVGRTSRLLSSPPAAAVVVGTLLRRCAVLDGRERGQSPPSSAIGQCMRRSGGGWEWDSTRMDQRICTSSHGHDLTSSYRM